MFKTTLLTRFLFTPCSPHRGIASPAAKERLDGLRNASLGAQTYMLVDQDYTNVLSLLCEPCKSLLYLRIFGLMVNDKEIPLCIRWLGNVADACE